MNECKSMTLVILEKEIIQSRPFNYSTSLLTELITGEIIMYYILMRFVRHIHTLIRHYIKTTDM